MTTGNANTADSVLSEQLEQVDRRIDQCLKDISQLLKTLPQDEKGTKDTAESRKYPPKRRSSLTLDNNYSLHVMLEKMNAFFQCHLGHESGLIGHLGELRKQMGLSLISSSAEALEYVARSAGAVSCSTADKKPANRLSTNILWEVICHVAEKYVLENLLSMNLIPKRHFEIGHYAWYINLNALRQIRTPIIVWELTQRIRKQQIDGFQCTCPPFQHISEASSLKWKTCFHCLLDISLQCIKEDQEFVSLGCFLPLIVTWTELCKPYIDRISGYFQDVLNALSKEDETELMDEEKSLVYCLSHRKHCLCSSDALPCTGVITDEASSLQTEDCSCSSAPGSARSSGSHGMTVKMQNVIKALLSMVESVYRFEKQLMYVSCGITSRLPILPCGNCCTSVFNGISLAVPFDSPEQSPLHQQSPNKSQDSYFICAWDWRSSMVSSGFLNFLQRSLQEGMQVVTHSLIKDEWATFVATNKLPLQVITRVVPKALGTKECHVLLSVAYVVKEIEKFVPLVAASQGAFVPFLASLSHTIHTYLLDLLNHVEKISVEVSTCSTVDCLYILLNSMDVLKGSLQMCNDVLEPKENGEQSDSSILLVTQKLTELMESLNKGICLYHAKMLKSCILQDAESLDWKNPKPFFEGERVSFAIEMWYLYMKRLVHKLSRHLPQDLARAIFVDTLFESMNQVTMQYSSAMPSKNRVEQFKMDITAMLIVVCELLYTGCTSLSELMGVDTFSTHNSDETQQVVSFKLEGVHSLCCTLLVLLAIHSSPLPTLYKVFKKGLPSFTCQIPPSLLTCAPWLPWIHPSLFSSFRENAVMSSISVWHAAKLCASQMEPNPFLIVKAYTCHSCTMSILLTSQSCNLPDEEANEIRQTLISSIFTVLVHSHYEAGIATVLLPVIDRCEGWNEFDMSVLEGLPQQHPWWYSGLMDLLQPALDRVILGQLPKMWHQATTELTHPVSTDWQELKLKLLSTIRCSCHPSLNEWPRDLNTLANVNALEILSCLVDHVPTLPVNLVTSLAILGKHVADNYSSAVKPCGNCMGLQVLLCRLVACLKIEAYIQNLMTEPLTPELGELCRHTADTLKGFAVSLGSSNAEQTASHVLKEYHESAQKFIKYIIKTFQNIRIPPNDDAVRYKHEPDKEYLDQSHLQIVVSNIMQDPKGPSSLLHLHHLLQINLSWIKQSLGVPSLFPRGDSPAESSELSSALPEFGTADDAGTALNRTYTIKKHCSDGQIIVDEGGKGKGNIEVKGKKIDDEELTVKNNNKIGETEANDVDEDFDSGKSTTMSVTDETADDVPFLKEKVNTSIESQEDAAERSARGSVHGECVSREISLKLGPRTSTPCTTSEDFGFNPLKEFAENKEIFDQQHLSLLPFLWDKLLAQTPLLGLSEVGFKTLLLRRWEFQGLDSLPDGHEKYVESLKSTYGPEENGESLP